MRCMRRGLVPLALGASMTILLFVACSSSDDAAPAPPQIPALSLTTGEAALAVIGGGSTPSTNFAPVGGDPAVAAGRLYLSDTWRQRVLGYHTIPTSPGAAADFVLGQPDLSTFNAAGTSATRFRWPATVAAGGGKLAIADKDNGRVLIWNSAPTTTNVPADVVVGKETMTDPVTTSACTADSIGAGVWSVALGAGKLVVADYGQHRVLVWNTVPTTSGAPADLVLGQASFTACAANRGASAGAATMNQPCGVWTDGTRLLVTDSANHRVLVWKTFPVANGQPADLVLGQPDLGSAVAPGAATSANMATPMAVTSNGTQIAVADRWFHRVLVWNALPAASGAGADVVLGQASFDASLAGTGTARMNQPSGLAISGDLLIVGDGSNSRYLVFR